MECVFCKIKPEEVVTESLSLRVLRDRYPVSPGHLLIVPKAHKIDFFELSANEVEEVRVLLGQLRAETLRRDPQVTGFNIGMNCGKSAGQTVFHCHIHLIPRRGGDAADPRGGVRGVIPGKQSY